VGDIIKFEPIETSIKSISYAESRFLRDKNKCLHVNILVDERDRTVRCEDCGMDVDPVMVLIDLARGQRDAYWEQERLKKFREKLNKDIKDIERRKRCSVCRKKLDWKKGNPTNDRP
jgi:hypothetical protein